MAERNKQWNKMEAALLAGSARCVWQVEDAALNFTLECWHWVVDKKPRMAIFQIYDRGFEVYNPVREGRIPELIASLGLPLEPPR